MDAIETILKRRSVRQMMPDKEISKDEIMELLEIATKQQAGQTANHGKCL